MRRATQCFSEWKKNQSIYCFIKLKMEVQKERGIRNRTRIHKRMTKERERERKSAPHTSSKFMHNIQTHLVEKWKRQHQWRYPKRRKYKTVTRKLERSEISHNNNLVEDFMCTFVVRIIQIRNLYIYKYFYVDRPAKRYHEHTALYNYHWRRIRVMRFQHCFALPFYPFPSISFVRSFVRPLSIILWPLTFFSAANRANVAYFPFQSQKQFGIHNTLLRAHKI